MASSGLFGMYIFAAHFGGLAHLVERKHGMFEVTGSIPVSSTKEFIVDSTQWIDFLVRTSDL